MVTSLSEYLSILQNKISKYKNNEKLRIYYRGEPETFPHPMAPSAFRGDENKEVDNYYRALRRHPEEFKHNSPIDILAKLQHFGYPTRMLDFTVNSLMALFFACGGINFAEGTYKDNGNGHVFVYVADYEKEVLKYSSDKGLLLSVLPRFKSEELKELESIFRSNKIISNEWMKSRKENKIMQRFIHELRVERRGFNEHRIESKDILDKGYFIKANFSNNRLKTQGGLFAIFGLGQKTFKKAFNVKENINFFDIEIDKNSFKKILGELDYYCNINYSIIYDDLEATAKSYKNKLY